MTEYHPTKIRPWRIFGMCLRGIGNLLSLWPLLLLLGFYLSPTGPHVRMQYTYELRGTHRQMLDCDYLGLHGFVKYVNHGDCPVFIMLDQ